MFAGNILIFKQKAKTVAKYVSASNTLRLRNTCGNNIKLVSASNKLTLTHQVPHGFFTCTRSATNRIRFQQVYRRFPKTVNAHSALIMWHSATRLSLQSENTLSFTQQASVYKTNPTRNRITLSGTASCDLVRIRSASNTLTLLSRASVYKPRVDFVTIGDMYSYVPVTFSCDGEVVSLPKPDFDDVEKIEVARINRKSRGGDPVILRDPIWPKTVTLTMQFSWLKPTEAWAMQAFMRRHIGKEVIYVNYEGRSFSGVITNTEVFSRVDKEGYITMPIEMEIEV